VNDTSQKIEKIYQGMLMALSPSERLTMACRMYDVAKILVIAGISKGGQHLTESQIRAQFFLRMYGCDLSDADRQKIINGMPNM